MLFKAFYFKDKVKTSFCLSTQKALEIEPTLQANSAETLQLELANPLKSHISFHNYIGAACFYSI